MDYFVFGLVLLLDDLFDDVFVVHVELVVNRIRDRVIYVIGALDVASVFVLIFFWSLITSILHDLVLQDCSQFMFSLLVLLPFWLVLNLKHFSMILKHLFIVVNFWQRLFRWLFHVLKIVIADAVPELINFVKILYKSILTSLNEFCF